MRRFRPRTARARWAAGLVRRKGLSCCLDPELRQWQAPHRLLRRADLEDKGESEWPDVERVRCWNGWRDAVSFHLGKVYPPGTLANGDQRGDPRRAISCLAITAASRAWAPKTWKSPRSRILRT
ncbi:hypothetical protein ACPA9J_34710 [Pseudomonas aeruginosa]